MSFLSRADRIWSLEDWQKIMNSFEWWYVSPEHRIRELLEGPHSSNSCNSICIQLTDCLVLIIFDFHPPPRTQRINYASVYTESARLVRGGGGDGEEKQNNSIQSSLVLAQRVFTHAAQVINDETKLNLNQRWLLAFKETNQNTQAVKMNAFLFYGLDKTMCTFSANFACGKATNGQTELKHEMW